MDYLIDGYNLLHAFGIIPKRANREELIRGRAKMLQLMLQAHEHESDSVTVVFDAQRLPKHIDARQFHQKVEVVFAVDYAEADDLIEERILLHPNPGQLAIVSDDRRLRTAARKRRCRALRCGEYLDWMENALSKPSRDATEPGVSDATELSDTQYWLKEFSELDNDPAMKELFDPFDFETE